MRVRAHPAPVDPHPLEQVARTGECVALPHRLVRLDHVDELVADPHHRVECAHRALEDHRDVAPAEPAQLLLALPRDVVPPEQDPPTGELAGRPEDLEDRVRGRALAAARLAREPDGLAGTDREADAVDGTHAPLGKHVIDVELLQLDQDLSSH